MEATGRCGACALHVGVTSHLGFSAFWGGVPLGRSANGGAFAASVCKKVRDMLLANV